jgi:hypothetical protein
MSIPEYEREGEVFGAREVGGYRGGGGEVGEDTR